MVMVAAMVVAELEKGAVMAIVEVMMVVQVMEVGDGGPWWWWR